jgi:hypothetical protein
MFTYFQCNILSYAVTLQPCIHQFCGSNSIYHLSSEVISLFRFHSEVKIKFTKSSKNLHLTESLLEASMVRSTVILLAVLYGCETWSLTLRGKRRLTVFENRVLKK